MDTLPSSNGSPPPFGFAALRHDAPPLRRLQGETPRHGLIRQHTTQAAFAPSALRRAQRGSVLVIVALLSAFLIGFLGVAVYTGLNMYLQNELSNAVTLASGVGASAYYDTFDAMGIPQKNAANAQTAAQSTFANLVASNPALTGFNTQLVGGAATVNAVQETVRVEATASVPTPLLAPIGIDSYDLSAVSLARYARRELFPTPQTLPTLTGPGYLVRTLTPPLVDAPGPDLYVGVAPTPGSGYHGLLVEACAGNKCYDLGAAARMADATSVIADRQYPGGITRRVLYGNFYIDLSAVNPTLGYNKSIKKATIIKIIDDGFHDYVVADGTRVRGMEIPPGVAPLPTPAMPDTVIQSTQILHNAVYCPASGGCVAPKGYVFN